MYRLVSLFLIIIAVLEMGMTKGASHQEPRIKQLLEGCRTGNYQLVKSALENRANINYHNHNEGVYTAAIINPLYYALYTGTSPQENREKIVKLLIKYGADIKLAHSAWGFFSPNLFKDYDVKFKDVKEILGINVEEGNLISKIIENNLDFYDQLGKAGHVKSASLILVYTLELPQPLLRLIAYYLFDNSEIATYKSPYFIDNSGMSAFMYAISRQYMEAIRYFFQVHDYCIDFSHMNCEGETALVLAQKTENNEILAFFKQYAEQLIDLLTQKGMPRPIARIIACYILGEINLSQPIQEQSKCLVQ